MRKFIKKCRTNAGLTQEQLKQVSYITGHQCELEKKIRENGRPTLEILGCK